MDDSIMRTYEPRWSAEEQTMIDMMKLTDWMVGADIEEDLTSVAIWHVKQGHFVFKADTEYEAIRKAFKYWAKRNEN